jgi:hypothetical protein
LKGRAHLSNSPALESACESLFRTSISYEYVF